MQLKIYADKHKGIYLDRSYSTQGAKVCIHNLLQRYALHNKGMQMNITKVYNLPL